jgi:hypothetical protein
MDILFVIKVFYFYILALCLAILEIQIEGTGGWAANLPTWRAKAGSQLDRIYKKLFQQKDLTGYHLSLNIFLLLFLHWPFVWSWQWNIWDELEVLAIFVVFVVVWDFLWFVLNPNFSLRKFKKRNVSWHKRWWEGLPVDYCVGILAGILLLLPATIIVNPVQGIFKISALMLVNLILLVVTVLVYPKAY